MVKKGIISLISFIILGFSLILVIPIFSLSFNLSPYGIINEHKVYKYTPGSVSPVEKLNITTDFGDVKICYSTPPVNYFAKIELDIEMRGLNLAGINYTDLFDIAWQDASPEPSFNLKLNQYISREEISSLIHNITLSVTLRADAIFDIIIKTLSGDISLDVPNMVSVNNVVVNTSRGDIFYKINHCNLAGNSTCKTLKGNLNLDINNVEFTRNVVWNFSTQSGNLDIKIHQDKEMGGNLTSTIVFNGLINLTYFDNLFEVGALFTFPTINWNSIGQYKPGFTVVPLIPSGFELKSNSFPTKNYFRFTFFGTKEYKCYIING